MNPVEPVTGGVRVRLRVQPRAGRTELAGVLGDAIKLRVAGAPVDGAANEDIIRFLSRELGVPRGSIEIVSGRAGRNKVVRIEGASADQVRRWLIG